jgi:hypothetical protein
MLSKEAVTRLLGKLEHRLQECLQCCACLDGVMAALEFTVAAAQGLPAGLAKAEDQGRAGAARAFALRGSRQTVMPWEKIHVS